MRERKNKMTQVIGYFIFCGALLILSEILLEKEAERDSKTLDKQNCSNCSLKGTEKCSRNLDTTCNSCCSLDKYAECLHNNSKYFRTKKNLDDTCEFYRNKHESQYKENGWCSLWTA